MNLLVSGFLVSVSVLGATSLGLYMYTASEPYSVNGSLSAIHQVVAKLDKDSFMQRLTTVEKYNVANKIQFIASVIAKSSDKIRNHNELAATIVTESLKANIDPMLVVAIVKSESSFRTNAISHKGARGLMQLMPDTAKYTAVKLQKPLWRDNKGRIHDKDYNLSLGITYLKHLEDLFDGDRELALIAYNWGPGNLKNAIKNNSRIPESTKLYARKIMKNHERWNNELRYVALASLNTSSNEKIA